MSEPRNSSNSGSVAPNPELVMDVKEANAQYVLPAERQIPKGYKQTEVGVIPEDWDVTQLKEAATVVDSLHQTPSFSLDGYPMVRVTDIKPGNLRLTAAFNVSQSVFMNFIRNYKPKRGDIVLSRVGSYGVSSFVETDEPFCMGQNTVVIDCKKPSRFLYYVLNSKEIRRQIEDASFGTGYKSLSLKNINGLKIPLPPTKAEQEAIAEALSDADALIEALEQLVAKKRQLKQGAMQELLTGKRRLPGFEVQPGYKQTEVGLIPKDWSSVFLGTIFEISAGGDLDKGSFSKLEDDLYPYPIYANAVTNMGLYGFSKNYQYEADKITVTARGDVGTAVYRNTYFNAIGRLLVLTPKQQCDLRFLAEYIDNFVEFAFESTGVPQLTAPQISKYQVALPGIEAEQTAIAQILTDMDAEITVLETKLAKARAVMQGMMQQLLTGKIRLVVNPKPIIDN
ncbi:restriction endonuclease subunit S [Methylomonas sp. HYX-M1]|uniref:restriction endonuclease subunit S n=1 Tax=Methylomonas sp. HYX-M1 TaxID=3139307 RepID=UPI00345C5CFB